MTQDDPLQALWTAYLDAERIGHRDIMRAALDEFVAALQGQGGDFVDRWAMDLVERVVDSEEAIPIRSPLFRRVLAPALVKGVRERRRGCARWLAHFEQQLTQARRELVALPEELRTASGLLQEALRVDSSDTKARRRLIEGNARYLAYTLHELPAGVLYGHDSASIEECTELLSSLDDFRSHLDVLGERSRYAELVANCQYHFEAYRKYLAVRLVGQSYAEFLAAERGA
jgi:hypothetical protein